MVASHRASLLRDGAVRGLPEAICHRVLVQRAALDHPLYYIVVGQDRSYTEVATPACQGLRQLSC